MKDKDTIHFFRKRTVLTIKQLSEILDSSEITSRRKLKRWGCFSSINANSRYYVLPDIPRFDANGLWIYRQICFSKHGYLKQSIVCLIRQSEAGIQTQDILKLVGLPDNSSVLSQVMRISGIQRERFNRAYIYFSDDAEIYLQQRENRERIQVALHKMPSDAEAIVVLVQLIKHPNISIQKLAQKVNLHGIDVPISILRMFLENHDLLKYIQTEADNSLKKTSVTEL